MTDPHLIRVHIAASGNNFENDLPYLRKVVAIVYNNSAIVTHDWIDAAVARKKRKTDEKTDWSEIVEEDFEDTRHADLVIVEATTQELNQGIQTCVAARHKKPTLILARSKIEGCFISGITNKYITVESYKTEEDLEKIVTKFIKKNAIPEKDLRFNFILTRRIYKYLRDTSYETGKNKSEIIRELLERDIKRRDS